MAELRLCPTTGKVCHPTRSAAVAHAKSLERKEGTEEKAYSVYPCPDCQKFHIGHKSINQRLRQARKDR